jgi:hypothetical protein
VFEGDAIGSDTRPQDVTRRAEFKRSAATLDAKDAVKDKAH